MPKMSPKTKAKTITLPSKAPSSVDKQNFFAILQERFETHMERHPSMKWETVEKKLQKTDSKKLKALYAMELTGGEPDVVTLDDSKEIIFIDCSKQSPARRSVCYDAKARKERKKFPPQTSAEELAKKMGIELLNEEQYRQLQEVEDFDTTTSSWLLTPKEIRKNGGAIFGDRRYDHVFIYHNGADSYYGARGFRGLITV